MLRDVKARSVRYDRGAKTATLDVGAGSGKAKDARGTALLDGKGGVVGVDVDPDSAARVVVLVGRHEDVKATRDVELTVTRDAAGEVVSVVVHDVG